ncbi:MAG TPA: hypothetical protein VF552_11810 [Allosphingosinicella sp.]|jgi:hypothetical protein
MTAARQDELAAADALFRAILAQAEASAGRPLADAGALADHLRSLARASLETAAALAEGRVGVDTAREAFEARRRVLVQMRAFAELAVLNGAGAAADAIFRLLARAVRERTGIDLAPGPLQAG